MFAKAKTGGGKTLAFLIPALERLLKSRAVGQKGVIGILVVSPTRELALQVRQRIHVQARVIVHCLSLDYYGY